MKDDAVVLTNHVRARPSTRGFCRLSLNVMIPSAVVLVSTSTLIISWYSIRKDELGRSSSIHLHPPHLEKKKRKQPTTSHRNSSIILSNIVGMKNDNSLLYNELQDKSPMKTKNPVKVVSSIKSGPQNSDIYQPSNTGKRLLTYRRFGGRLNNQLFQFITALQHSQVLKRTFVVPNEIREMDWTGMFDGGLDIWNLESLNDTYDIDWKIGLMDEFVSSIPEQCVMTPAEGREILNGGPKLWKVWDEKCPDVIDLAGNTGLLFCKQQHQFCGDYEAQMEAYRIYSHIKLSPSLIQYIPSKREEFKNMGYNELAVHSRRAGEGGYDWEMCVKGNTRTCRGHIEERHRDKFCDVRTMKGNCAAWLDLGYQIKSKTAFKENQIDYRFVLASDGTHDWNIDFKNQFVIASNKEWLNDLEKRVDDDADPKKLLKTMSISAYAQSQLRRKNNVSSMRSKLDGLTSTLLDLFSLVDSKYLLGAYYSTLSLNACYFRGLDRVYDSNMCWMLMHPSSKHAILPPRSDTINVNTPNMDDQLPAALMSDVEHAFVRSNDGNFIVIDRYVIDYPGRKQVIGVLGDGLVPITIEKKSNGKEKVRADFTCSYGDTYNSPATIILMKGNQSLNEHYYERGKKYKTPFSTNGDRFRTMIILCEELVFDKSLARHPPLILQSRDDNFFISVGSTFQRPVRASKNRRDAPLVEKERTLVHCLNPVYGLKDPRWIIEYLEYHRAIGVDHVHVYNVDVHTPEIQEVFQIYRDEKFITRHDWSGEASGEYTSKMTYEHAKWAAQTDCALRSRGIYDYALFSDIDEVIVKPDSDSNVDMNNDLMSVLELLDEAKKKRGKNAFSFNSNTVTSIYTKLDDAEEKASDDNLMLERYDRIEAKPLCPANCQCVKDNCKAVERTFHMGRQKYIANVGDLDIPPRPMWTHALSRDYDEMKKVMEVLPDDVLHVRHYQGHWYINRDLINSVEEIYAPLLPSLMDTVRTSISLSGEKKLIYDKAKGSATSHGVEWIKPVDRPAQYHKRAA